MCEVETVDHDSGAVVHEDAIARRAQSAADSKKACAMASPRQILDVLVVSGEVVTVYKDGDVVEGVVVVKDIA